MLEPKTELVYKCFTEQIRENYQRIGAVYFSVTSFGVSRPCERQLDMLIRKPERKLRKRLEVE